MNIKSFYLSIVLKLFFLLLATFILNSVLYFTINFYLESYKLFILVMFASITYNLITIRIFEIEILLNRINFYSKMKKIANADESLIERHLNKNIGKYENNPPVNCTPNFEEIFDGNNTGVKHNFDGNTLEIHIETNGIERIVDGKFILYRWDDQEKKWISPVREFFL